MNEEEDERLCNECDPLVVNNVVVHEQGCSFYHELDEIEPEENE